LKFMLTIAFCQDSPGARHQRPRYFKPHMEHLRGVMKSIRLAAPLATADGAAISDDDRLVASVFAIDLETVAAASDLMAADPYMSQRVWSSAALYVVEQQRGLWLSTGGVAQPQGRMYVMFSTVANAPMEQYSARQTLYGANLRYAGSLGDSADSNRWQAMEFFVADDLSAARSRSVELESKSGGQVTHVWAVPLAVGSWPDRLDL
jgi:uncharacterized protein YciI